jgi:hypothetical protein
MGASQAVSWTVAGAPLVAPGRVAGLIRSVTLNAGGVFTAPCHRRYR